MVPSASLNTNAQGSPGYQAYGLSTAGYARRARVTEISQFGKVIRSWKRLDDESMSTVDDEILWAASAQHAHSVHAADATTPRHPVDAGAFAALPRRSQKGSLH